MATVPQEKRISCHVMLSPQGKIIKITDAVFDAFMEFIDRKFTGEVSVQFRDGGIAGVGSKRLHRNGSGNGNGG